MRYNSAKDTNEILELFASTEFSVEDAMKDNIKKIAEYYDKNKRHKYHVVSRFVYKKMESGEDAVEYLLDNVETILNFLRYKEAESEQIIKKASDSLTVDKLILFLEKLYDHIALEEERLIKNNQMVANNRAEIEDGVINKFEDIANSFDRRVREVTDSLNANVITIVGLFSAIIFVFFGGITGMSSVVKHIANLKEREDIILPLIIILAMGLVLFDVIFLLLYSISKFTNKNIGCIVPLGIRKWYYYEKREEKNEWEVCSYNNGTEKIFFAENAAKRYVRKRNKMSIYKNVFFSIFKRLVLRFPYVFIINVSFVVAITYLYINFK